MFKEIFIRYTVHMYIFLDVQTHSNMQLTCDFCACTLDLRWTAFLRVTRRCGDYIQLSTKYESLESSSVFLSIRI